MPAAVSDHTATLLPNGKVLVAGGDSTGGIANHAFVFDPDGGTNGSWTTVGSLNVGRFFHSATLLPNGKVLVAGGEDLDFNSLTNAEIFDPATSQWTVTASLHTALTASTLTLLPNGKVLAVGGLLGPVGRLTSAAELYDIGLGFTNSAQPQITSVTSPLNLGNTLAITGSKFRGNSEASGGNGSQSSSSDCPVVQLRSIENGQVLFVSAGSWQTNAFVSLPVTNFPPGYALLTVFVNGTPSSSATVLISPASAPIVLTALRLPGGAFRLNFTNIPGTVFTTLASTNLSLNVSNWTILGSPSEIAPGQFQFTDPGATNGIQRFYRVSSP
jgi:hypothetical protein